MNRHQLLGLVGGGLFSALLLTGPVGCDGLNNETGQEGEAVVSPQLLSPRGQLIRLSMDLLGTHPTEAELQAIELHPDLYEDYVDRYIDDPRFLDRMSGLFNLQFHTRTQQTYFDLDGTELEGVNTALLGKEIGEEPLQLLRHIIKNDLPYSEIVTAPFTFATPLTAAFWDLDYPNGETGWQVAYYKDSRPLSGMLSMGVFWQRYPSAGGNANRHRANTISRLFLCDDFLKRPLVVNRAAVDQLSQDPETAIRTNDSCQSCHSSLDPLAASLFGFFRIDPDQDMGLESGRLYRSENEQLWKEYSGRAPGYFGRPLSSFEELGQQLAEDPRFSRCAVETVFEGLTQRFIGEEDWTEFEGHHQNFVDSNQNLKVLVRSIVLHENYLAAKFPEGTSHAERIPTVKTASPEQIATVVEDLTGYRWTFGGADGLTQNVGGLQVLAGGVDSQTVLDPSYMPAVGVAFVQERLAQSAAHWVVLHDFNPEREGDAYLLSYILPSDNPADNPDKFDTQIRHLYHRATGLPLAEDAPEVTAMVELWVALHSLDASPEDAWTGVISAVLRDPNILFY